MVKWRWSEHRQQHRRACSKQGDESKLKWTRAYTLRYVTPLYSHINSHLHTHSHTHTHIYICTQLYTTAGRPRTMRPAPTGPGTVAGVDGHTVRAAVDLGVVVMAGVYLARWNEEEGVATGQAVGGELVRDSHVGERTMREQRGAASDAPELCRRLPVPGVLGRAESFSGAADSCRAAAGREEWTGKLHVRLYLFRSFTIAHNTYTCRRCSRPTPLEAPLEGQVGEVGLARARAGQSRTQQDREYSGTYE